MTEPFKSPDENIGFPAADIASTPYERWGLNPGVGSTIKCNGAWGQLWRPSSCEATGGNVRPQTVRLSSEIFNHFKVLFGKMKRGKENISGLWPHSP